MNEAFNRNQTRAGGSVASLRLVLSRTFLKESGRVQSAKLSAGRAQGYSLAKQRTF